MAMTVNTVGDQPIIPGSVGFLYVSDQLIAGDLKLVTQANATIAGGLLLPRGTVMGKQTVGALVATAKGGNTGNGTITNLVAGTQTKTGNYILTFTGAAAFTLVGPDGQALPNGVAGNYVNPALNFTETAGGVAFVAGDQFTINVAVGADSWVKSVATAVDGSQVPQGILAEQADATGGNVNGGIYLTGEFNENRVAYDVSWTLQALRDALRPFNIFLKSAIIADPAS
jgi:hypothetical protein